MNVEETAVDIASGCKNLGVPSRGSLEFQSTGLLQRELLQDESALLTPPAVLLPGSWKAAAQWWWCRVEIKSANYGGKHQLEMHSIHHIKEIGTSDQQREQQNLHMCHCCDAKHQVLECRAHSRLWISVTLGGNKSGLNFRFFFINDFFVLFTRNARFYHIPVSVMYFACRFFTSSMGGLFFGQFRWLICECEVGDSGTWIL